MQLVFKFGATVAFGLKHSLLWGWYSNLKPLSSMPYSSDWKCKKALLVDEMKVGGNDWPQYLPIRGAVFELPSYKVKESISIWLNLNYLIRKRFLWQHETKNSLSITITGSIIIYIKADKINPNVLSKGKLDQPSAVSTITVAMMRKSRRCNNTIRYSKCDSTFCNINLFTFKWWKLLSFY